MLGKLSPNEIEEILMTESIGRIGCHANGRTYVVPISYAYDGKRIIGHSADGMKLKMMRENPEVCFQVEHVANLGNWKSVIAWGRFEELKNAQALSAMNLLVEKMRPFVSSETAMPTHGAPVKSPMRAVVYAIRLTEKTGRFEQR